MRALNAICIDGTLNGGTHFMYNNGQMPLPSFQQGPHYYRLSRWHAFPEIIWLYYDLTRLLCEFFFAILHTSAKSYSFQADEFNDFRVINEIKTLG